MWEGPASWTYIIQKYIENPLLYKQWKFDIRIFTILTSYNGTLRAFFFEECGYIRTSCKEFSLDNLQSKYVHLTNDAVQQHSENYGKFENGNKVSF